MALRMYVLLKCAFLIANTILQNLKIGMIFDLWRKSRYFHSDNRIKSDGSVRVR